MLFTRFKAWFTNVDWCAMLVKLITYCRWFNMRLTTAFGIPTVMHWSVPLLLFISYLFNPDSCAVYAIAFFSIIPHEYGHALAAKRFKIKTRQILLYPIGGIALIDSGLKIVTGWEEFWITVAGPLVSLGLSLIGFAGFILEGRTAIKFMEVDEGLFSPIHTWNFHGLWAYLFIVNLVLFVFNLLPIFPMDGGRILRALLSISGFDYLRSTQICVKTSIILGIIVALLGLVLGNVMLAVVMLIMIYMAKGELYSAQIRLQAAKQKETNVNS